MAPPTYRNVVHSLQVASLAGGIACTVLGALVLLGWLYDITLLKSLHPTFASMKPNTGLGFILGGTALWLRHRGRERWERVARTLAVLMACIGAATVLEYVTGWSFGIDGGLSWLLQLKSSPPRMSVATATGMMVIGLALLLRDARLFRGTQRPAEWLALAVAFFGLIALLGYAYGVKSLYTVRPFASVALHTVCAFLIISAAILFERPDSGLMRFVVSDSPGGAAARRLLPVAVSTPVIFGWLRLKGQDAGLYDTRFGLALFVTVNVVTFTCFVWWTAAALSRAENARRSAEAQARESETEALRTELASAQSRARLNALYDAGILGIIVGTLEGRILEVNDALLTALGYTRDEILSGAVPWRSLTPPEWRDADARSIQELTTRGTIGLREKEYFHKNGSRVPVLLGSMLLPGTRDEVIAFVLDLTANKQAAIAVQHLREMQASEAKFRGLLEAAPDAVVIVDSQGRIALVNSQTERLFGYDRSELLGAPVKLLCAEHDPERDAAHGPEYFRDLRARAAGSGLELRGRRKDGSELPMEISTSPLDTDQGPLAYVAVRDITERKAAEAQRSRLASIVDSSDDAIIGTTLDGLITSWNGGAQEMFGYTPEEVIGQPVSLLAPPDRESEQAEVLLRLIRGERVEHFDTVRRRKDGTSVQVSVRTSAVRDPAGDLIGASKIFRDITERKRAAEALARAKDKAEAANKELEAFSYSVAHDLRSPLRAMNGFAHMLLEAHGDKLDAQGRDRLQRILNGAKKMGELIDGLLSLARLSRSELQLRHLDLSAMVREALAGLRASDPSRAVEAVVQEHLDADADPRLARALIENLLANAWKFTRKAPAPRIEVGTMEGERVPVFYVRDNGAGFDMAFADKLFAPFQRLHSQDEYPGTGIGLATVQRIVQRHGGSIWAEGSVGQGATFYFTLGSRETRFPS